MNTPLDVAEIAAAVGRQLDAAADPERKAHNASYMPSALAFRGVAAPALRDVVRDVAGRTRRAPPEQVVALARALVATGVHEDRQVGWELLGRHKAALASLDAATLEALGTGNDNWASVDSFAVNVTGRLWLAGLLADEVVARWASSPDRWWRRTALVSTVPLNKKAHGGTGDAARTLAVCGQLVADHDDMVVKALSWALRSLSDFEPEGVRDFLSAHPQLHRRVVREVGSKLDTGRKTARS